MCRVAVVLVVLVLARQAPESEKRTIRCTVSTCDYGCTRIFKSFFIGHRLTTDGNTENSTIDTTSHTGHAQFPPIYSVLTFARCGGTIGKSLPVKLLELLLYPFVFGWCMFIMPPVKFIVDPPTGSRGNDRPTLGKCVCDKLFFCCGGGGGFEEGGRGGGT
jgi:hypothetical protein